MIHRKKLYNFSLFLTSRELDPTDRHFDHIGHGEFCANPDDRIGHLSTNTIDAIEQLFTLTQLENIMRPFRDCCLQNITFTLNIPSNNIGDESDPNEMIISVSHDDLAYIYDRMKRNGKRTFCFA